MARKFHKRWFLIDLTAQCLTGSQRVTNAQVSLVELPRLPKQDRIACCELATHEQVPGAAPQNSA